MTETISTTVSETASPSWASRRASFIVSGALFASQIALALAVAHRAFWLAIPLVFVTSHFMHGLLIAFHEASHGLLRKSRILNELDGVIIGVFSFMSFTLYRAAHQTHHVHLATERDEELWPFVLPEAPRRLRVLAAFFELTFGMFFTPFLFARTFFRRGSPIRSKKVRRRIRAEFALIVGAWCVLLFVVGRFGLWTQFCWLYLAPAWLAGNAQSWRKYIEHVGVTGTTANSATRSIVSPGPVGRLLAFTLLHEPLHGVHHIHAGISHFEYPQYTASLNPKEPRDLPPFKSYRHALLHLLRQLSDPRAGSSGRSSAAG